MFQNIVKYVQNIVKYLLGDRILQNILKYEIKLLQISTYGGKIILQIFQHLQIQ